MKEHRRFSFAPSELTVSALYEALGLPIVLAYTDEDGDNISVRTQPDLDEFVRTRRSNVLRMHATVARSLSGSSISQAVKPAVRAMQKMAEPHIETAKNMAGVAVESAKQAASTADVEVKSAATSTCVAVKKVAEEAIVLGVRGYSLAYDSLYPGVSDAPVSQGDQCQVEAQVASPLKQEEPKPEEAVPPAAPLSGDFVKIESAPVLDMRTENLLNELSNMGFGERERNRELLFQNNMDIAATVAMLLDA